MHNHFNALEAQKFLEERESRERESRERERLTELTNVVNRLKNFFHAQNIEIYLVGSITQPFMFYPQSDIDIVVKNFHGNRFDLWTELESLLNRKIEIILFENCHFQDHIIRNGYKVL